MLFPVFTNVIQVYSMANLHDISWGTPLSASSGTNAITQDSKKQQELKSDYMVYRVNFLTLWLVLNIGLGVAIEYTNDALPTGTFIINDGTVGSFVEGFAVFIASIACYRAVFGFLHILNFKCKSNYNKKYRIPKFDLHEEVKRLRLETVDWNESLVDSDIPKLKGGNDLDISYKHDDDHLLA